MNRCLEPDRAARWQSAFEIGSRLDEWLNLHGYQEGNDEALGSAFVRRNAMRQMRWFERAIAGEMDPERLSRDPPPRVPTYTEHTRPRSEPPPTPPTSSTGARAATWSPLAPRPRPTRARYAPPTSSSSSRSWPLPSSPRAPASAARRSSTRRATASPPTSSSRSATGSRSSTSTRAATRSPATRKIPPSSRRATTELQAIRAEARSPRPRPRLHRWGLPPPDTPGAPPPDDLIADDDSDDRVTEVKREAHQKVLAALIADPDSELPTAPIERRRAPLPSGPRRPPPSLLRRRGGRRP